MSVEMTRFYVYFVVCVTVSLMMKNSKFANAYLPSITHSVTFPHVCVRSRERIEGVANDYDPYSMSNSDVG